MGKKDYFAPGRGGKVRSQRSEVRSQRSEVGSQRSEVGSQRSEVGSRRSEVRSRRSAVGSQYSQSVMCCRRGKPPTDTRPWTTDHGPRTSDFRSPTSDLGQDFPDHIAVHVGQAPVGAVVTEGEPLVVDAEEVQEGCVEIVAVGFSRLSLPGPFVALAVGDAALDARAGHPRDEGA